MFQIKTSECLKEGSSPWNKKLKSWMKGENKNYFSKWEEEKQLETPGKTKSYKRMSYEEN
jgi:hypothetical protein